MAASNATLVVRKTFLEVQQDDDETCFFRPRAMTDSMLGSGCWDDDACKASTESGSTVDTGDSTSCGSWADCESPRSSHRSEDLREFPQVPEPEPEETRTTLIMQGLPACFSRDDLLNLLRSHGYGMLVNFVYVPVDILSQQTSGFGFANFTSAEAGKEAMAGLQNLNVEGSIVTVEYSEKDQGLELLIARHRNSPLMHHSLPEELRPLLLRDGKPVPFPAPTKKIRLQSLMQQLRRRQRNAALEAGDAC